MKRAGFVFTATQLLTLQMHHTTVEEILELQTACPENWTEDDLIVLVIYGLSADDVLERKETLGDALTIDALIRRSEK